MTLEPPKIKLRNPHPLGVLTGPGQFSACDKHKHLDEFHVIEIAFQLIAGEQALVGYADMDPETMENVLCVLEAGDVYPVRLESGMRELLVGDFGVFLPSEKESVLITIKY